MAAAAILKIDIVVVGGHFFLIISGYWWKAYDWGVLPSIDSYFLYQVINQSYRNKMFKHQDLQIFVLKLNRYE